MGQTMSNKLCLPLLKTAHFLFLTYSLLGHIDIFKVPLKSATFLGIMLLIVNFIIQYDGCTVKEFVGYGILMALSLIHSYSCNDFGFFKLMLFAGSIKKVHFKDVVRFDMYLRGVLIVIVCALCELNVIPDVAFYYNGILRRSMGFTNPNTLGTAVFIFVCDVLYIAEMKLNFKLTVLISAITYWLYAMARSRTAVYAIIVLLAVSLIYRIVPSLFKTPVLKVLYYCTPIALSLLTLIVTQEYINFNEKAIWLDVLLSGRINVISMFAELLEPTFFGQQISLTLDKSLDNVYAFVWFDLGIMVFFLFHFFYLRLIKLSLKAGNIAMCMVMLAFMFYGLAEHLWINVDYNIFMLAFCCNPVKEKLLDVKKKHSPKKLYI